MTLIWVVLVIAVIGGTVAVALGKGASMAPVHRDQPAFTLPTDRPVGAEDLSHAQFTVGVRGYRMDEVDALIVRLRDEIAYRDQRLSQLEPQRTDDYPFGLPTPSAAPPAPTSPGPSLTVDTSPSDDSEAEAAAWPAYQPEDQGRSATER